MNNVMTKLKNLSKNAKMGLAAAAVGLAALGISLAIWQPWNQPEPAQDEPTLPKPQVVAPDSPTAAGPSLKIGNEEIPCTVYTANEGWSIYVPDGWTAGGLGDTGAVFTAEDGAQLSVTRAGGSSGFHGSFVSLTPSGSGGQTLLFFSGSDTGSDYVYGDADTADWSRYERIFAAMARTFCVPPENASPFAESFVLPKTPDWQEAEGVTVLFLDKDGFVLDDKFQEAVKAYMLSWPEDSRAGYTGQYQLGAIQWAGSYTGLTDGYIDVFGADVQYMGTDGNLAARQDTLYLAVWHDGGSVAKTDWIAETDGRDTVAMAAALAGK